MNPSVAAKAYVAALVSVALFIGHGVATGDWTNAQAITPALTIVLLPLVVWVVPNDAPR